MRSKALVKNQMPALRPRDTDGRQRLDRHQAWYRRFGGICSSCLSEDEKNQLAAEKGTRNEPRGETFPDPRTDRLESEKFPVGMRR